MKSFAARLSVVVLAASGFAASTIVSYASTNKHEIKPVVFGPTSPCPMCLPSKPGPCGMD
jgi:hypothetical protein